MNNINVLDEKLTKKGYEKSTNVTREKTTTYYSSDEYGKCLGITSVDIPIIMSSEKYLSISDKNLCLVPKREGKDMSMPCVYIDTLTYYLYQVPEGYTKGLEEDLRKYEASIYGLQADHKNHNRFDNSDENIRFCKRSQNSMNKRCNLPVPKQTDDGGYTFRSSISYGAEKLAVLEERGYTVLTKVSGKKQGEFMMESKSFADEQSCCQEARWFNDFKYGEFAYCPENDFEDKMSDFVDGNIGEGTALLIRHKILQEISYEEMIELNKQRLANEMYNGVPLTHYMN